MIVFLLLLLISILLFGSSAVLGVIGYVLGAIVLVIAVALGVIATEQIPAWLLWTLGLLGGGTIVALYLWDERQKRHLWRRLAEIEEQGRVAQERIREDGAQWMNLNRQGSTTKFYNHGLNKKKRKAHSRRVIIEQSEGEGE